MHDTAAAQAQNLRKQMCERETERRGEESEERNETQKILIGIYALSGRTAKLNLCSLKWLDRFFFLT